MRKLLQIYLFVFLFFSANVYCFAVDTTATVILFNPQIVEKNSLEFELKIINHSDNFSKFSNASFQFEFADPHTDIDSSNYYFAYYDQQQGLMSENYQFKTTIQNNTFNIYILGPDDHGDCLTLLQDSSYSIGKYRIENNSGLSFSDDLVWKEPSAIFQALAYKIENDSIIDNTIVFLKENDNIEMIDALGYRTCSIHIEKLPPPEMKYNFQAVKVQEIYF